MVVCVQHLVADRLCSGAGQFGQHRGAGSFAQPVQRASGRAGRGDRVIHRTQSGWDLLRTGAQQLTGSSAKRAAGAPATLVELVLDPAVGAHVRGWNPSAIRADTRVRSQWDDQPALLTAAGAGTPAAQRCGVTRLADRPFRPARRWRSILPAMRTRRGPPLGATGADRFGSGGERTGPAPLAAGTGRLGHLVAAVADFGQPVMGPAGDPTDPPRTARTGAAGGQHSEHTPAAAGRRGRRPA